MSCLSIYLHHKKYHQMKISILLVLSVVAMLAFSAPTPPIYNNSFHITFDETYVVNSTHYRVNGQTFYDPINKRERVDRTNGRYNLFCGGVLPNVTTPCQNIVKGGKRFIVHPQRNQCCFCCDDAHGCGILAPDWLKDAQYKGTEKLIDTDFDKWSKDGDFGYNYFWVTTDANKIPRRLDENGSHITDYIPHTYMNQTFPDSTFALPAYCNEASPANCPLSSICGKLRSNKA